MFVFTNPLIDDAPFVNAGGLVEQSTLTATLLVTPLIVMSHVAVPALILPAVMLIVAGAARDTVAEQPAPVTVAVAPGTRRKPEGSVSVNAIPDCRGLPDELVRRKLSGVTPPSKIDALAKLFVSVGAGGGVTTRHWLVTPLLALVRPLIDD